jgi:hypothetical protein
MIMPYDEHGAPRLLTDIARDLGQALRGRLPDINAEEVPRTLFLRAQAAQWPERCRWVAVFAVTGDSEGHYIHVEAFHDGVDMTGQHTATLLLLGKTFGGWARAHQIAGLCAELLGA